MQKCKLKANKFRLYCPNLILDAMNGLNIIYDACLKLKPNIFSVAIIDSL